MQVEPFGNVKLSFKCPKQLNELQPCNGDWYCDGCRKMVYDFRGMGEEQVLASLVKNNYQMCGLFEAGRIAVLPQQNRWLKWIPTALLTFAASIIQSCTNNSFFPIPDNKPAPQNQIAHTAGIVVLPPGSAVTIRESEMQNYLRMHLHNPTKLTDTININYTLDKHGYVTRVKVLKSKYPQLDAEIVKTMLACPRWMPIEVNGVYVKKQFTVSLDLSQIK